MSLAATLRPSLFSLNNPAPRDECAVPLQHEAAYLALKRRLVRYQNLILLTPAPASTPAATATATSGAEPDSVTEELTPLQRQIQAELWSPLPYHRTKWLHNIEGARNLLLQLERTARGIKVQRTRQQVQKDLAEKRLAIKRLRTRIEEIGREVDAMGSASWKLPLPEVPTGGETVWDMLQSQSQSQSPTEKQENGGEKKVPTQAQRVEQADAALREGKPIQTVLDEMGDGAQTAQQEQNQQRDALFTTSSSGTVRRRGAEIKTDSTATATATATTTGASGLSTNERALLDSSRTQEALTTSMISMAVQLKQQAQAFQFSLEQDKGLLDRALEGLDKNLEGMQAAGQRMQFLHRMSEEQGWLGRLKLYALIMGMWAIAILLVFAGPKLRF